MADPYGRYRGPSGDPYNREPPYRDDGMDHYSTGGYGHYGNSDGYGDGDSYNRYPERYEDQRYEGPGYDDYRPTSRDERPPYENTSGWQRDEYGMPSEPSAGRRNTVHSNYGQFQDNTHDAYDRYPGAEAEPRNQPPQAPVASAPPKVDVDLEKAALEMKWLAEQRALLEKLQQVQDTLDSVGGGSSGAKPSSSVTSSDASSIQAVVFDYAKQQRAESSKAAMAGDGGSGRNIQAKNADPASGIVVYSDSGGSDSEEEGIRPLQRATKYADPKPKSNDSFMDRLITKGGKSSSESVVAHKIRKCRIQRWPDFQGYGFHLNSDQQDTEGHYIAGVVQYSPAEAGCVRPGDKVVEINGNNVMHLLHDDIVQLVTQDPYEVTLLVVDADTEQHYRSLGTRIHGGMEDIELYDSMESASDYRNKKMAMATESLDGAPRGVSKERQLEGGPSSKYPGSGSPTSDGVYTLRDEVLRRHQGANSSTSHRDGSPYSYTRKDDRSSRSYSRERGGRRDDRSSRSYSRERSDRQSEQRDRHGERDRSPSLQRDRYEERDRHGERDRSPSQQRDRYEERDRYGGRDRSPSRHRDRYDERDGSQSRRRNVSRSRSKDRSPYSYRRERDRRRERSRSHDRSWRSRSRSREYDRRPRDSSEPVSRKRHRSRSLERDSKWRRGDRDHRRRGRSSSSDDSVILVIDSGRDSKPVKADPKNVEAFVKLKEEWLQDDRAHKGAKISREVFCDYEMALRHLRPIVRTTFFEFEAGMRCPVCPTFKFESAEVFGIHWRYLHMPKVYYYKCLLCEQTFKRRPDALEHCVNSHKAVFPRNTSPQADTGIGIDVHGTPFFTPRMTTNEAYSIPGQYHYVGPVYGGWDNGYVRQSGSSEKKNKLELSGECRDWTYLDVLDHLLQIPQAFSKVQFVDSQLAISLKGKASEGQEEDVMANAPWQKDDESDTTDSEEETDMPAHMKSAVRIKLPDRVYVTPRYETDWIPDNVEHVVVKGGTLQALVDEAIRWREPHRAYFLFSDGDILKGVPSTNGGEEFVFAGKHQQVLSRILSQIKDSVSRLFKADIIPIFADIVPVELDTYNFRLNLLTGTSFAKMQTEMNHMVFAANKIIAHYNSWIGVSGVDLNQEMVGKQSDGASTFLFKFLADGFHPSTALKSAWQDALKLSMYQNRKKMDKQLGGDVLDIEISDIFNQITWPHLDEDHVYASPRFKGSWMPRNIKHTIVTEGTLRALTHEAIARGKPHRAYFLFGEFDIIVRKKCDGYTEFIFDGPPEEAVKRIVKEIKRSAIRLLVHHIKPTFGDIVPVDFQAWNQNSHEVTGYPYTEMQQECNDSIAALNLFIRQINRDMQCGNIDLTNKIMNTEYNQCTVKYYFLADGLHPVVPMGDVWKKNLADVVEKNKAAEGPQHVLPGFIYPSIKAHPLIEKALAPPKISKKRNVSAKEVEPEVASVQSTVTKASAVKEVSSEMRQIKKSWVADDRILKGGTLLNLHNVTYETVLIYLRDARPTIYFDYGDEMRCPVCPSPKFRKAADFGSHWCSEHIPFLGQMSCRKCSFKTQYDAEMKTHRQKHHNDSRYDSRDMSHPDVILGKVKENGRFNDAGVFHYVGSLPGQWSTSWVKQTRGNDGPVLSLVKKMNQSELMKHFLLIQQQYSFVRLDAHILKHVLETESNVTADLLTELEWSKDHQPVKGGKLSKGGVNYYDAALKYLHPKSVTTYFSFAPGMRCPACPTKKFDESAVFGDHWRSRHVPFLGHISCKECGFQTVHSDELIMHYKEMHETTFSLDDAFESKYLCDSIEMNERYICPGAFHYVGHIPGKWDNTLAQQIISTTGSPHMHLSTKFPYTRKEVIEHLQELPQDLSTVHFNTVSISKELELTWAPPTREVNLRKYLDPHREAELKKEHGFRKYSKSSRESEFHRESKSRKEPESPKAASNRQKEPVKADDEEKTTSKMDVEDKVEEVVIPKSIKNAWLKDTRPHKGVLVYKSTVNTKQILYRLLRPVQPTTYFLFSKHMRCPVCPTVTYGTVELFAQHWWDRHSLKKEQWVCKKCSYSTGSQVEQEKHQRQKHEGRMRDFHSAVVGNKTYIDPGQYHYARFIKHPYEDELACKRSAGTLLELHGEAKDWSVADVIKHLQSIPQIHSEVRFEYPDDELTGQEDKKKKKSVMTAQQAKILAAFEQVGKKDDVSGIPLPAPSISSASGAPPLPSTPYQPPVSEKPPLPPDSSSEMAPAYGIQQWPPGPEAPPVLYSMPPPGMPPLGMPPPGMPPPGMPPPGMPPPGMPPPGMPPPGLPPPGMPPPGMTPGPYMSYGVGPWMSMPPGQQIQHGFHGVPTEPPPPGAETSSPGEKAKSDPEKQAATDFTVPDSVLKSISIAKKTVTEYWLCLRYLCELKPTTYFTFKQPMTCPICSKTDFLNGQVFALHWRDTHLHESSMFHYVGDIPAPWDTGIICRFGKAVQLSEIFTSTIPGTHKQGFVVRHLQSIPQVHSDVKFELDGVFAGEQKPLEKNKDDEKSDVTKDDEAFGMKELEIMAVTVTKLSECLRYLRPVQPTLYFDFKQNMRCPICVGPKYLFSNAFGVHWREKHLSSWSSFHYVGNIVGDWDNGYVCQDNKGAVRLSPKLTDVSSKWKPQNIIKHLKSIKQKESTVKFELDPLDSSISGIYAEHEPKPPVAGADGPKKATADEVKKASGPAQVKASDLPKKAIDNRPFKGARVMDTTENELAQCLLYLRPVKPTIYFTFKIGMRCPICVDIQYSRLKLFGEHWHKEHLHSWSEYHYVGEIPGVWDNGYICKDAEGKIMLSPSPTEADIEWTPANIMQRLMAIPQHGSSAKFVLKPSEVGTGAAANSVSTTVVEKREAAVVMEVKANDRPVDTAGKNEKSDVVTAWKADGRPHKGAGILTSIVDDHKLAFLYLHSGSRATYFNFATGMRCPVCPTDVFETQSAWHQHWLDAHVQMKEVLECVMCRAATTRTQWKAHSDICFQKVSRVNNLLYIRKLVMNKSALLPDKYHYCGELLGGSKTLRNADILLRAFCSCREIKNQSAWNYESFVNHLSSTGQDDSQVTFKLQPSGDKLIEQWITAMMPKETCTDDLVFTKTVLQALENGTWAEDLGILALRCVIVSGLNNPAITRQDVMEVFSAHGEILQLQFISASQALIHYKKNKANTALASTQVKGETVSVKPLTMKDVRMKPSSSLLVERLPIPFSNLKMMNLFKKFGTMKKFKSNGDGSGTVEMGDIHLAARARIRMEGYQVQGQEISIKFNPEDE